MIGAPGTNPRANVFLDAADRLLGDFVWGPRDAHYMRVWIGYMAAAHALGADVPKWVKDHAFWRGGR